MSDIHNSLKIVYFLENSKIKKFKNKIKNHKVFHLMLHTPTSSLPPVNTSIMNNSARTKFTPEEDSLLVNYVQIFGMKSWKAIALLMPGRSMRQCRERWKYFLSPDSNNHNQWTAEEDDLLIWQYQEIGPQWSKMAPLFKGRSGVSLKNRYHLLQRNNFLVLSENDNETTPEPTSCSSSEDENGVSLKTKPIVSQSTSKSSTPEFPEHVQQSPIEVVPFNKRNIDFPCSIGQLGLMFN